MTREHIDFIVAQERFPAGGRPVSLIETHISWLILTPAFVYKIKKPVKFSFLDFSTPEQRAFYCRKELHLNQRLAPDMYLQVLPIGLAEDGQPMIGVQTEHPIDMAVCMKRMDGSRQMDKLLLENRVTAADMEALAGVLARFHQSVLIPADQVLYHAGDNRTDFDDLFQLEDICREVFGEKTATVLADWRKKTDSLLDQYEPRLHARAQGGFWVDGHGDLHGRNIFLLPEGPLVFDCIEFNPHFRKLDVLSELAFLCMELEAGGNLELAAVFLEKYCRIWDCMPSAEDQILFRYFKAYRANVRLKVTLLAWQQHRLAEQETTAKRYWDLLGQYLT